MTTASCGVHGHVGGAGACIVGGYPQRSYRTVTAKSCDDAIVMNGVTVTVGS
jgi:hypothetical protein